MAIGRTDKKINVPTATLNTLRQLGLTSSEAKIYLAILVQGKTNISDIAVRTGINRRNVYDALSTLIDKGLAFQFMGVRTGKYAAVEPQKLLELIQSREVSLSSILPDLQQRFHAPRLSERAVIYKGIEGFKNYLEDILAVGQEVFCLGAKGGWGFSELGDFADWFEQERIRKKIKVYNLFDQEMRPVIIGKKPMYTMLSEHRFLPKKYSTNSAADAFGTTLVTFTGLSPEKLSDDVTLFVLNSQEITDSFRRWFMFMWVHSEK